MIEALYRSALCHVTRHLCHRTCIMICLNWFVRIVYLKWKRDCFFPANIRTNFHRKIAPEKRNKNSGETEKSSFYFFCYAVSFKHVIIFSSYLLKRVIPIFWVGERRNINPTFIQLSFTLKFSPIWFFTRCFFFRWLFGGLWNYSFFLCQKTYFSVRELIALSLRVFVSRSFSLS